MSREKYLVYASLISIFAVFIWGAFLSGSGYGAACGVGGTTIVSDDWPYCKGSLSFPSDWPAQVEYIHRLLSVVATVLLVGSNMVVWRMTPRPTAAARTLMIALVLLLVELFFAGVVVKSNLNVVYGTVSLTIATTIFGLVTVAADRMHLHQTSS